MIKKGESETVLVIVDGADIRNFSPGCWSWRVTAFFRLRTVMKA